MKVLDYSPIPFEGGKLSLENRIKGIMRFGFSWIAEMKSQEIVIRALNRVLDNKFTLLQNVPLPHAGITVPFILLGPPGVTVIYNSVAKGLYRVQGDSWAVMDSRSQRFKPAKPNLVTHTALMSRAVGKFITQGGHALEVEGVLIFTDPGIHVDTMRSNIRIVLVDAIEHFGARLMQAQPVMGVEDVRAIVNAINKAIQPKDETGEGKQIVPRQQVIQSVDTEFTKVFEPLQKKMNFSRRQWLLLGGILVAEIIILAIFLVVIILTA